jgi:hypothetical protein
MLPALAPEKGGDPRSGEDRRHFMPLIYCVRGLPRFPVKTVEDPTSEGGICHTFMMKSWQMYSFDDKFVEFGSVLLSLQTVNI